MIEPIKISTIQANNGLFCLVFALSGYGKTSSVRNFPKDKTAIITSEPQGLTSLSKFGWESGKFICPTTPDDYLKAIESCLSDNSIKHIVIDTLSQYFDLLIKQTIERSDKSVEKIGLDLYRVSGLLFQKMFRRLLEALSMGKDVVGLVHLVYREEGSSDERRQIKEPALSGQLAQWVCRQAVLVVRGEKVRAGKDTRYVFVADGIAGDYGKDIYQVTNGVCDNDLWKLMESIRSQSPAKPAATNAADEPPSYAKLLKIANGYGHRRPAVDAWLRCVSFDVNKADANWQEAIDRWTKENAPF